MAFKMTQKPTFTATVEVQVPNDRGGFDRNTFVGTFKRMAMADVDQMRYDALTNEEVARKVLIGWEMKDGDTGEDVPFTRENLEAALQIMPTPLAVAQTFFEHAQGQGKGARTKN